MEPHTTLEVPKETKPIEKRPIPGGGNFWLSCWFALNIILTLMNKAFFSRWDFSYPITLSFVHMLVTCICTWSANTYFGFPRKSLDIDGHYRVFFFAVLFCANVMLGNVALHFLSVSLVQVVRSTIPGIAMLLSFILLGKGYNKYYLYSVSMVVVGVGLASFGEDKSQFNILGFTLTVLVCFLSALKSVLSQKFLAQMFHPMDLLSRMTTYSVVFMFILGNVTGEHQAILNDWWPKIQEQHAELWGISSLLLNGFLAFLLNFCNFVTTKKTSALTVTIAGNVKHVATIILSVMVFKNPISNLNAIGTVITVIGAAVYSYLGLGGKENKSAVKYLSLIHI
eukprot:TRINITY_DN113_c0_g2_i1.p1 TRINITY_DN113_c0_g2~~TRINITY_DN113_c0_g2_i1.p1  ORF type:complete len:339 (-),score=46.89 TRINITY_DN113_c0_g2_i1:29-1045(-)